jgi:hypothetical protein
MKSLTIDSLILVVEDFLAVCCFLHCQNPTLLELRDFLIVFPMVRVGAQALAHSYFPSNPPVVNAGCFSQPNEKSNSLALAF